MNGNARKISLGGAENLPRGRTVNVRVARFGLMSAALAWLISGIALFAAGMWLGTSGTWRSFVAGWTGAAPGAGGFWQVLLLAADASDTPTVGERMGAVEQGLQVLKTPIEEAVTSQMNLASKFGGVALDLKGTAEACIQASRDAATVRQSLDSIYAAVVASQPTCPAAEDVTQTQPN